MEHRQYKRDTNNKKQRSVNPSFCGWSSNNSRFWNRITKIHKQVGKHNIKFKESLLKKTKILTFKGKHIRSERVIINKITEQINTYNYLGRSLSYEKEKKVALLTIKILQIRGITCPVLKPSKVRKQTRLRI